jgi:23S rRNA (cytidine1920-2'-O)/16S rRNA (cytidine1409-2'-O)-methyltransferase
MRLDVYLVEKEIVRSRGRAKDFIATGNVKINGEPARKGSQAISDSDVVELTEPDHPYVSRAALKLKGLLTALDRDLKDAIVLDIGASTGGFTQIALEYGAHHVYALDVGTSQLNEELQGNKQITSMEQTDARDVTMKMFPVEPSVLLADVSFISLEKILPTLLAEIDSIFEIYCLVKPQFEVGKGFVEKGVVTNEDARLKALSNVEICIQNEGFEVVHDMVAPLAGSDGNIEYMVYASRP